MSARSAFTTTLILNPVRRRLIALLDETGGDRVADELLDPMLQEPTELVRRR